MIGPMMGLRSVPRRRALRRLGAAGLVGLLVGLVAAPVLAHEERDVGDYSLDVGFIAEPVYVGQRSGLELHVTKAGQPVPGLAQTVKAEVIFGSDTRDLPLTERVDEPGWYELVFIPTAAGKYTFHLTGTIEGTDLDESFTSSPAGFDEVQEATAGEFPSTLPTVAELTGAAARDADAANQVRLALLLGGAGLVIGLLALGIALAGRRRPAG